MKKLLLLLCIMSVFAACEDIQDNSPALQAEIDDVFFKSLGSVANINADNTLTIQASTSDQTLTLVLSSVGEGSFELGGTRISVATFEDASGNLYSTAGEGSGSVTISSINPNTNVSGSFNFSAIRPGIDTLVAQKGIFFEVPFTTVEIEEPIENPEIPDGTFVAEVDGELFNPTSIEADLANSLIIIEGTRGDATVRLAIAVSSEPGQYSLPGGGYFADYVLDGVTENATDGTIRIFEHDMAAQTIKGTFVFTTDSHTISLGQFNVGY